MANPATRADVVTAGDNQKSAPEHVAQTEAGSRMQAEVQATLKDRPQAGTDAKANGQLPDQLVMTNPFAKTPAEGEVPKPAAVSNSQAEQVPLKNHAPSAEGMKPPGVPPATSDLGSAAGSDGPAGQAQSDSKNPNSSAQNVQRQDGTKEIHDRINASERRIAQLNKAGGQITHQLVAE